MLVAGAGSGFGAAAAAAFVAALSAAVADMYVGDTKEAIEASSAFLKDAGENVLVAGAGVTSLNCWLTAGADFDAGVITSSRPPPSTIITPGLNIITYHLT